MKSLAVVGLKVLRSDVAQTVLLALVAGIACGVTMAYLLGNHAVAWGSLAEWLTAAGAFIAAWVAWTQLRRFNENARAKNTLQYMNKTTQDMQPVSFSQPVNVAMAVGDLDTTLKNWPTRRRMHELACRWEYMRTEITAVDAPEEMREYLALRDKFVMAANFFSSTAGLAAEGLIDGRLFLDFYAIQVVTVWEFAEAFSDASREAVTIYKLPSFYSFVREASEAYTSEPKPKISYPTTG
ncbi:MAG TPA: hypothetical protein VGF98_02220 [Candidatus Tumulicola sp.]|jgi:hypothetical protein